MFSTLSDMTFSNDWRVRPPSTAARALHRRRSPGPDASGFQSEMGSGRPLENARNAVNIFRRGTGNRRGISAACPDFVRLRPVRPFRRIARPARIMKIFTRL